MNVVDTVKNAAFASAIQAALNYMDKDPEVAASAASLI